MSRPSSYRSFDIHHRPDGSWSAIHEDYTGDHDPRHLWGHDTRLEAMEAVDEWWADNDVPRPEVSASERERWAGR